MESPKDLVRRFVEELWNARKLEVADEIFAANCVTHQLRSGAPVTPVARGPEVMREHLSGWLQSFPDLRFSIEQTVVEGDRVASHLVMEGTHEGAWMGIPPTGKKVQIRMFTIHHVANGKIVEDWVLVETLGMFQQLGILPDTPDLLRNFAERADKSFAPR
ncbi:MAG TPA: ester cyclase [Candidatus Sulfotelmatobacter sp.]|nr:ester cyclase [Candidatus Sulfotelmatobacter sp.]